MATNKLIVPFLSGSTEKNNDYLGKKSEITIDSDLRTIRVHDGIRRGGEVLLRKSDLTDEVNPAIAAAKQNRDEAVAAAAHADSVVAGVVEDKEHALESANASALSAQAAADAATLAANVAATAGTPPYMCAQEVYVGAVGEVPLVFGGENAPNSAVCVFNKIVANRIPGSQLQDGGIFLPAGTYRVNASAAPGPWEGIHQARLQDLTHGKTLLFGPMAQPGLALNSIPLFGEFVLDEAAVIQLQLAAPSGPADADSKIVRAEGQGAWNSLVTVAELWFVTPPGLRVLNTRIGWVQFDNGKNPKVWDTRIGWVEFDNGKNPRVFDARIGWVEFDNGKGSRTLDLRLGWLEFDNGAESLAVDTRLSWLEFDNGNIVKG